MPSSPTPPHIALTETPSTSTKTALQSVPSHQPRQSDFNHTPKPPSGVVPPPSTSHIINSTPAHTKSLANQAPKRPPALGMSSNLLPVLPLPRQHTLHKFLGSVASTPLTSLEEPETWGHMMDSIDTSSVFRILPQNPNGINPSYKDTNFQYSLTRCNSYRIGTLCLVETKLNWNKPTSVLLTKRLFNRTWQHSTLQQSQGAETHSSSFQPGGTLTAVMDRWSSRTHHKGVDPYGLGRWSFITLRG
jgi:hypothetical protein